MVTLLLLLQQLTMPPSCTTISGERKPETHALEH